MFAVPWIVVFLKQKHFLIVIDKMYVCEEISF